jgi:hypothetical protein
MIRKKDTLNFFKLQIIAAKIKIHFWLFFSELGYSRGELFKEMKNVCFYTSIYCVQTIRFLGGVIGAKIGKMCSKETPQN